MRTPPMPAPVSSVPMPSGLARVATVLSGSVGGMFRDAAFAAPKTIALRAEGEEIPYLRLNEEVNRLCHALTGLGLRPGDRIAILAENSADYIRLMLACAKTGMIVACLSWRQNADDIAHCLALTAPGLTLVSPRFAHLLPEGLERLMLLGPDFTAFRASGASDEPEVEIGSEEGLLILYTSGTTGRPKAPVISHRAVIARSLLMRADWNIRREDGAIVWSPLFHMAGADPALSSLIQGATLSVLPGFNPTDIADALEVHPVGWLVLIPGMIERLAEELERRNAPLQRVAAAGCMANLVPGEQIARISRLLNAPFLNSFGSTETGIVPASGNWFAPGELPTSMAKLQSSGCEIRLLDEDGNPVPPGAAGEICIRSPALFSGYWGDAEATERAFVGGWYHMGDDFVRDEAGALHFADRRKYLIKSGGENIYPAELEQVLRNCPGVLDAVVVRRPDPIWGEIPIAFIVADDPAPEEAHLRARIETSVARFKHPKEYHFIPEAAIERNQTGKIRRDLLEERAAALKEGNP